MTLDKDAFERYASCQQVALPEKMGNFYEHNEAFISDNFPRVLFYDQCVQLFMRNFDASLSLIFFSHFSGVAIISS